jgi:hypothetical protein
MISIVKNVHHVFSNYTGNVYSCILMPWHYQYMGDIYAFYALYLYVLFARASIHFRLPTDGLRAFNGYILRRAMPARLLDSVHKYKESRYILCDCCNMLS